VEEEQIYAIPFVVDAQAALATDEGEVVAQFEEKGFEVADERVFKIALGILVAQAEEFKDEGMSDFLVGADAIAWLRLGTFAEHGGLVTRQGRAFVELAVHLALELAHRPASAQGFGLVEGEGFGRAAAADEQDVVGPGQREGAGQIGKR
jgi:hypothetical protein